MIEVLSAMGNARPAQQCGTLRNSEFQVSGTGNTLNPESRILNSKRERSPVMSGKVQQSDILPNPVIGMCDTGVQPVNRSRNWLLGICLLAMSGTPALGEARLFMTRPGEQAAVPVASSHTIFMDPATSVTLEVWVDDTTPQVVGSYQVALPGSAPRVAGSGTLTYIDRPAPSGDSVFIDRFRPEWIYTGIPTATVFFGETGLPAGFAFVGFLPLGQGPVVPGLGYLGEFEFEASADANGTFVLEFLPLSSPPDGGTGLTDETGVGAVLTAFQQLVIRVGPPPANDDCTGATAILVENLAFDTATATTSAPNNNFGGAGNAICADNGDDTIENDIWYTFTALCDGLFAASTCNQANFDTRIEVYEGCGVCPPTNLVACYDNQGGCSGGTSAATFSATAGTCFTIRLGGADDLSIGSGTLTTAATDGCFIDGVCRLTGAVNPANECEACVPGISSTSWSPRSSGIDCADDGDACTSDVCDGAGACGHPPAPAGTLCSGGTPADCFVNECDGAGFCGRPAPSGTPCTEDGNVCTDDECNGTGICIGVPNIAPCNDFIFCNGSDTCGGGSCSVHSGDPCAAGEDCQNVCNEAAVSCNSSAGTTCLDEGDLCTDDLCNGAGTCTHPPAVNGTPCEDDGNQCTDNICDGVGTCVGVNNAASCDDSVFCNGADTCSGGNCSIHAGNPCFGGPECANLCDEIGGSCDRPAGTPCTNDGNVCTDNACDGAGTCAATPNSDSCEDNLFCNGLDTCAGGACSAHTGDPCAAAGDTCVELTDQCVGCVINEDCTDDGNACTDEICSGGTCISAPNNGSCDDGVFCNGADTCSGGNCSVHAGNPCFGAAECADLCDETGDTCDVPVGVACTDDGDVCTSDECDGAGACGHPPASAGVACPDDGIECTLDECDGLGACGHPAAPSGVPCTDDGDQCTLDECDGAGVCGHPPAPSGTVCPDDGIECTLDECDGAGLCAHPPQLSGTPCLDDSNDCTGDECDGAGACSHPPLTVGTPCDDGLPCTGTGEPGVGVDECDGAGSCSGSLDPSCADNCLDAAVALEGTTLANNTGFGTELQVSCAFSSTGDTWFSHTANCTGQLLITTTGSAFDTVLAVFDECGGTEVACDDDGGPGLSSALTINTVAGEDYFIRVAGFGGATGNVLLNIARLDTCLIDGICRNDTDLNPANPCEFCEAVLSAYDWSPTTKGTACGSQIPDHPQCDSSDSCNGLGACEPNHKPNGQPCGDPNNNDCDNPDSCDGLGMCQDNFEPLDFACGDPLDDGCNNPDTCDGVGTCLDNFEPIAFACGDPTDTECDNPDTCDGVGTCLQNLENSGFACGDPTNTECDNPDSCNGAGTCLINFEPPGFGCGDPADTQCDNADTCDGFGTCLDNFEAIAFACGSPADTDCDNPDSCDGLGTCLTHLEPTGFSCGDPADTGCDNPDTCDGVGLCLDNLESIGFLCGSPADTDCDNPDSCDGAGVCLGNLESIGFACGSPADTGCDNPDSCNGAGTCLENFELSGFSCGSPSDTDCDNPDTCSGTGFCLPNRESIGFLCGDPADTDCDNPDSCDGTGVCLDNLESTGFPCGNPGDTGCDNPDSCDGAGLCLDNFETIGFSCGDPSDTDCDNPDACDAGGICLTNLEGVGFACGSPTDTDCDNPDACDGLGVCLDHFESVGFGCGSPSDTECDDPDTCNGIGACLSNFESIGFACGSPTDTQCDNPDSCNGAGLCRDNFEVFGITCGDPTDTNCNNPDICEGSGSCLDNLELDGTPCPNGVFCDGDETCQTGVCIDSPDPCIDDPHCDEPNEACLECLNVNECADTDGNGIVDDGCFWYECTTNTCAQTPRHFGDMGGPFGDCALDGFTNLSDALLALTCFAQNSTCALINTDVGGPFGDCEPDGFCNLADALHALTAFANNNTCSCPLDGGGPMPEHQPRVVATARLLAVAEVPSARPGEEVRVRVFIEAPLKDLVGYQLDTVVTGGRRGYLELIDFAVENHGRYVFGKADNELQAFNLVSGQMLNALQTGGMETPATGYLATLTYRASDDAQGTFVIDVLRDGQTYLVASFNGKIDVRSTTAASVVVTPGPVRSVR